MDYENAIDALENLDGVERFCFFVLWFHILRAGEQLHSYSLEGMVDTRIWRGFQRQLDEVLRLPGVRQYWVVRRHGFSDEFQAFVDRVVAETPAREPELFSMAGCDPGSAGTVAEADGGWAGLCAVNPVNPVHARASAW